MCTGHHANAPPAVTARHDVSAVSLRDSEEWMSKVPDTKKQTKKKAEKSLKEKRADKAAKKAAKTGT